MPTVTRWVRRHWLLSLLFVSVAAWAGTTYADYLRALAQRESSMNQYAVNRFGYAGLYQMGSLAMQDAGYQTASGAWTGRDGITSQASFLANAQAQTNAVTAYNTRAWTTIQHYGLDSYVGQTVNGVQITKSGLLAGYHLLGIGNSAHPGLRAFLQTGVVGTDANNTRISTYIAQFGGYDLPVAGTTYASVLAAHPTGGTSGSTTNSASTGGNTHTSIPASMGGASVLPTPSAPAYANALDGYAGGSGSTMSSTRNMLALVAGAACLTWLAYVLLGLWTAFADGRTELYEMNGDVVRGLVVVMLFVVLIW